MTELDVIRAALHRIGADMDENGPEEDGSTSLVVEAGTSGS